MAKLKTKRIFIGLVFISLAVILAVFGYQSLKLKHSIVSNDPISAPQSMANEQNTPINIPLSTEVSHLDQAPLVSEPQNRISLDSVINYAQEVYDESEKSRQEGLLWVDKKSSQYVATLGALNGVEVGSFLVVYQKDQPIGEVLVDRAFDVISYVLPSNVTLSENEYYKVVKK